MSFPHKQDRCGIDNIPPPEMLGPDRNDLERYCKERGEALLKNPIYVDQITKALRLAFQGFDDQQKRIFIIIICFIFSGCTLSELGEINRMIKRTEIEDRIATIRSKQIPIPPDIRALKEVPEAEPSS